MSAVGARSDHDQAILVTADGYERLRAELERLATVGRADLADRLREARDDGDLDDNPGLLEVLEEQAQLERRIELLEGRVAAARIAEPPADGTAAIGARVRLCDLDTREIVEYDLVGAIEADPGNGRLSVEAPVGRALVGRSAGAVVEVETPRGTARFQLLVVGHPAARKAA